MTLIIDCPNCGADVVEDIVHECPVSGTEILISRVKADDDEG